MKNVNVIVQQMSAANKTPANVVAASVVVVKHR